MYRPRLWIKFKQAYYEKRFLPEPSYSKNKASLYLETKKCLQQTDNYPETEM